MNSYQRVFNRLQGKEVDKIPNLNIIMTFAAKYIGIPYSKYVRDYKYLVEGNIKCCQEFGIDMVSAISDPCREGYDMGAEIKFPDDDVPSFSGTFITEHSDLKKIEVCDPLDGERMLDRIKAVELYKSEVNGEYPILGWVEGAFAEAYDLMGINLMMDLIQSPDFAHELLSICTEQAIVFAEEQVKAGADFIGIGDAAASLIGPAHYQEFVLPYEKRICQAIHDAGAKVKLHICGDISAFVEYTPQTGADMIDLDWMVDFGKAVETFAGKCSVCGNFDPVNVLLQGSSDEVREAVQS
ncbi:MAG: uroporphyrinogen decarboxylase family protein [Halanaerobiales bacterium]